MLCTSTRPESRQHGWCEYNPPSRAQRITGWRATFEGGACEVLLELLRWLEGEARGFLLSDDEPVFAV